MTWGRWGRRTGPEDARAEAGLRRRLQGLAASHEPDLDVIVQRVHERTRVSAREPRSGPGGRRWSAPTPGALVRGTAELLRRMVGRLPRRAAGLSTRMAPSPPVPGAAATTTVASSVTGAVPADGVATTTSLTWSTLLAVATVRDTVVVLEPEGTRDWLAAGVDPVSPGTVAREQGEDTLLGLASSGEPAVSLAPGRFEVRYSGGVPPHEHGTTTSWRTVRGAPGGPAGAFTVSVAPGRDRGRLQAWVGVSEGPAEVELLVDRRTVGTAALPLEDGTTPYLVTTMPLGELASDAQVDLVVRSSGDGVVGFAGAALR